MIQRFYQKIKILPKNKNFIFYLLGFLLLINLIWLSFSLAGYYHNQRIVKNNQIGGEIKKAEIIFLDVGQGDAILIKIPSFTAESAVSAGRSNNQNILIDGGPDKNIIYKLDQYIPFYQRQIDLMILTHPDPDHLNGLIEVLKRYKVRAFFYNGVDDESYDYRNFLKELDQKGAKKEIVWQGKKMNLGEGQIEFFYPFESLEGKNLKDDNDGSLVFKFINGQAKILFTGDAPITLEKKLLTKKLDLTADLFKIGHHGSKYSSSLGFLEAIKPKQAVISVGKNNKFGHPNLRVLKNLEKEKIKVLRTDQLGDIIFETNTENLKLMVK